MRITLPVISALLLFGSALAADPLYGPRSFETAGPAVPHRETFQSPAVMTAVVWIQNGDGEGGGRATGGQVVIAGQIVARPADFARAGDLFAKSVTLPKGEVAVEPIVEGGPAAMITIVVMPGTQRPDASVGRLVLPHAEGSDLTIALKNASRHARQVKVVFFDVEGNAVAWSHRFELPGHGSMSVPFGNFINEGEFVSGSIEVLWSGRSAGRLFGDANQGTATVEMPQAGHRKLGSDTFSR